MGFKTNESTRSKKLSNHGTTVPPCGKNNVLFPTEKENGNQCNFCLLYFI